MQRNHISWAKMSALLCLGFGNWRNHKMQLNPLIGAFYDRNILQCLKQNSARISVMVQILLNCKGSYRRTIYLQQSLFSMMNKELLVYICARRKMDSVWRFAFHHCWNLWWKLIIQWRKMTSNIQYLKKQSTVVTLSPFKLLVFTKQYEGFYSHF